MRRVLVALVLVSVVLLSGCTLIDIISGWFGDPGGGGGIGGVTFVEMIVNYGFVADVTEVNQTTTSQPIVATIPSMSPLVFDSATTTYTATTALDADPYVQITITLDYSGSMITYLHAFIRQTYGSNPERRRIDQIYAHDIPYDRVEGLTTFYRIDVDNVGWSGLNLVEYKDWITALHTEMNPTERIVDPNAAQSYFDADPSRYIQVEFRQ